MHNKSKTTSKEIGADLPMANIRVSRLTREKRSVAGCRVWFASYCWLFCGPSLFFLIKGYPSNPVKITKSDQVWLFKKSKLRRQWWHFISMPMNVSLGLASRIFWDCIILLFYSSTNFISDNDPLIQLFDRFERTSLEKNSDFKISFKYFK